MGLFTKLSMELITKLSMRFIINLVWVWSQNLVWGWLQNLVWGSLQTSYGVHYKLRMGLITVTHHFHCYLHCSFYEDLRWPLFYDVTTTNQAIGGQEAYITTQAEKQFCFLLFFRLIEIHSRLIGEVVREACSMLCSKYLAKKC